MNSPKSVMRMGYLMMEEFSQYIHKIVNITNT